MHLVRTTLRDVDSQWRSRASTTDVRSDYPSDNPQYGIPAGNMTPAPSSISSWRVCSYVTEFAKLCHAAMYAEWSVMIEGRLAAQYHSQHGWPQPGVVTGSSAVVAQTRYMGNRTRS
jgi:hypothetical protein